MGNHYFAHVQAQTGNQDEEPEDGKRETNKNNSKAEKDFMGHQQKDLCLQITFLLSDRGQHYKCCQNKNCHKSLQR